MAEDIEPFLKCSIIFVSPLKLSVQSVSLFINSQMCCSLISAISKNHAFTISYFRNTP